MSPDTSREYSNAIRKLKEECIDAGMREEEFRQIYTESLKDLNISSNMPENHVRRLRGITLTIILATFLFIFILYNNYRYLYTCIVCNLQEYIYPGLRFWRQISIPFISLFPSLTELYQETCLVQNPYFSVVDMDCWPCSNVQNVREIQDPNPAHQQHIAPFTYQTYQPEVSWEQLHELYVKNRKIFNSESSKIYVNNKYELSPENFFNKNHGIKDNNFYIWKINTLNSARMLRQLVPRPKIVPKFGQSSERFIIVDTQGIHYKIPDTECNYSFLLVLSGKRTISLKPAEECKHQCKSLKIELSKSYLLWYNWWYWRPIVQQTSHNDTFIAHVGSYC